jgi:hypothetical protein
MGIQWSGFRLVVVRKTAKRGRYARIDRCLVVKSHPYSSQRPPSSAEEKLKFCQDVSLPSRSLPPCPGDRTAFAAEHASVSRQRSKVVAEPQVEIEWLGLCDRDIATLDLDFLLFGVMIRSRFWLSQEQIVAWSSRSTDPVTSTSSFPD